MPAEHNDLPPLPKRIADALIPLCGYEWLDPFGEKNQCRRARGHDGDHRAHWLIAPITGATDG